MENLTDFLPFLQENDVPASWYFEAAKPDFAPPAWVFGAAWSILYPIIFVTFVWIFVLAFQKKIPRMIALPFALNLIANLAYSPLQFGLQNYWLATLDIFIVFGTLIWGTLKILDYRPWLAYLQIPYLFWIGFAVLLQVSMLLLN